jgi:hypothetical protein
VGTLSAGVPDSARLTDSSTNATIVVKTEERRNNGWRRS